MCEKIDVKINVIIKISYESDKLNKKITIKKKKQLTFINDY